MSITVLHAAATAHHAETVLAVQAADVSFSYRDHLALDHVSLAVPSGRIFGLLGPNGAGKSTLLSLLIGRRRADAGAIRVLGEPLVPRLRARIAIVFQEPSLDPNMTVRETLDLHAHLFNIASKDRSARTRAMLEQMGLSDRAGARIASLSGGMKRRLELARALLTQPELILLDEPTLALDPDSRHQLWQHLLEANNEGRTILLATNDVHEAERYCDTVALLDSGRVVAQGSPAGLKRDLRRDAVHIEWKDDGGAAMPPIGRWPGVGDVRSSSRTTHVTVDDASAFLTRLFEAFGPHVHAVQVEHSTLEDVYFQLVGRTLADHDATGHAAPPSGVAT